MISKMREKCKNKKGFTLVELIVVLVILAILIALLVPALTGYIDKAKKRGVETEARNALIAAQTEIDEVYRDMSEGAFTTTDDYAAIKANAKKLSEVPGNITTIVAGGDAKITSLIYTNNGYTASYTFNTTTNKGTWSVDKTQTGGGQQTPEGDGEQETT